MTLLHLPAALAASALVAACVTDVREGKIPNVLTFPLMAVGLGVNAAIGDPWLGVIGMVVATAIHFPLFALGVEKGGDAKLLMAIGALGGWKLALETTGWYAIVYVPVGLGWLAATGQLGNLGKKSRWLAARAAAKRNGSSFDEPEPPDTMLKTAPVIATAWALAYLTPWLERVL